LKKPYRHQMHQIAQKLRSQPTDAEAKLWYLLQSRNLRGYKFRRQHSIGRYVVDFYCPERKLIIEIDGGQHADQVEQDESRTADLNRMGYLVLRFWNNEVLGQTEAVAQVIMNNLEQPLTPALSPLEGERIR